MESNEGKWVSDVKTVCKITRLIPGSSLQVPWLWKQQNCPSAPMSKLVSTALVPIVPRALRILILLKRGQTFPVFAGSHSASQVSIHGWIRRIFPCIQTSSASSLSYKDWIPLLLLCVTPETLPICLSRLSPMQLSFPLRASPCA